MRLRIDSFGLPWNMPQSTRMRARSVVSRYCEPVTVVAAPRNCSRIVTDERSDRDRDERVDGDGEEQKAQVADRVLVEGDRADRRGLRRRPDSPQPVSLPQEDRPEDHRRGQVDE